MARQGKILLRGLAMDKELKAKLKEQLKPLGQVYFRPNKSYIAIWLKHKKQHDLVLCYFKGKKKAKLCLPWSTIPLAINDNLAIIIEKFLKFKSGESISKNIAKFEKQIKEEGLI